LVRLANIADLFDGKPSETPQFDLLAYAKALYIQANKGASPAEVTFTERTLGNNMDYETMTHYKWRVRQGHELAGYEKPADADGKVALEPQRIRLFSISYVSQKASTEDNVMESIQAKLQAKLEQ